MEMKDGDALDTQKASAARHDNVRLHDQKRRVFAV